MKVSDMSLNSGRWIMLLALREIFFTGGFGDTGQIVD